MYSGVGLQATLRESLISTSKFITYVSLEINYELSVNGQIVPVRVRLAEEVDAVSTGSINGTLTLVKGQQMCVNTTAIVEVSLIIICIRTGLADH